MQLPLPFLSHATPPGDAGIQFVRTPRAKRYVLRVKPDGTLRVTVPRRGSRAEALRFVERQRAWVERERRHVAARSDARRVEHGSTLLLRGCPVTVDVRESGDRTMVTYGERRVAVRPHAADLTAIIQQDLRRLAQEELVPRLLELASQHGLSVTRVTIRNQRSRWGSCSRAGAIALNYRLVQLPPAIRDYVLLHELMHLEQQNHSRRFWCLVARVCPEFRAAERWLRTEGRALL